MKKKIIFLNLLILLSAVLLFYSCNNPESAIFSVDKTQCNGCAVCIDACPQNAIELIDGKAVIDVNKCTLCGKCIGICPQDAIR